VIERQAAAVGLRFEAGLTNTILNEVRGQRVRMPLTQHALRELWGRRRGRWLRAKAYEDLGGVRRALATSADAIYNSSSPSDKDRLRTIFVRLTRLDRAGDGERRDIRQRSALNSLLPAGDEPSVLGKLIDQLEAKSLINRSPSDTQGDIIEFTDDVLIQAWPRLQSWLSDDREMLIQLADLQQQAQRWHERERDPSFLLRETQLADAAPLTRQRRYALNSLERAYIDASLAAQQEARQKEIAQLKALAKAEESKAKKQKQLTEKQRQLAEEQQRSAELALRSADRFRQLAIGMAGVAVLAIVAMIVAAVLGGVAQSNAQQAQQAAATADVAKDEAETQREAALASRNQALTAEALAMSEQGRADSAAADALNRALAAEAQAALDRGDPGQAIAIALYALERDRTIDRAALTLADAADQAARLRLVGHEASIYAVAYSPDGRSAVSGDVAGAVIFWDLERGRETLRFKEHTGQVNALAYSPTGQTAFSASDDMTVRAWGLGGGQVLIKHSSEANALAISPAGDLLVVGYASGEIILYGSANGQQIRRLSGPSDVATWSLAYSPDGTQIASGAYDGGIALWRAADGALLGSFGDHTAEVSSLTFSPNGQAILSASEDTTVSIWDLATGIKRFGVSHDGGAISAAYSPDGRSVVSSSYDQSVIQWDIETSNSLRSFNGHTSEVNGLAFSADGRRLLTGSFDHDLRLWDIAPRRLVRAIPQASGGDLLSSVAISDDGKLAAVGSSTGSVTIWNLERGEQVRTLSSPRFKGSVIRMVLTNDLLVAASSQIVLGWLLSDGAPINDLAIELNADIVALDFFDKGLTIATPSESENLTIVAPPESKEAFVVGANDEQVMLVGHRDYVTSVALSPDARQVLTGSFDRTMRLWDATSGQIIRVFVGHTRGVRGVTFSPDGKQALSVSEDRTMRLWDLASGRELARFTTTGGQLSSVALDASGTRAISGAEKDGTLLVWQIETLDELIDSVKASRSLPELGCELRARYALAPLCPTATPTVTTGAQP
jgi:WD40 repeat protein